ncbi:hypothetical protein KIW84_011481 [Lathyrus oleraceus]|uniref:Protein FAR1-RELATED SEQUENCE n=1 Tax=Pisum sativum TaxID=3888 RepID=A0A9D5BF21_PEA|nr:hypothetical protein KIW84_011481 [Pisum sativum]
MCVIELEKNVKHGDLPFLRKYIRNFFNKIHQDKLDGDANDLLQFCKCAKDENSCFQFAFTVDKEEKLENIFWSPPHCFELYQKYGDVVAFDTTYKHITAKFSGWFTSILRNRYSSWCADFYKLDNIDDFEEEWFIIVSKYNLEANKHIKGLYEVKQYWVPAYLRGYFFGGMITTGRSESINGFVKRFTSSRSCAFTLRAFELFQCYHLFTYESNSISVSDKDIQEFRF